MSTELKLHIEGKEKTFTAPFVPALVFRKIIEYKANMNFEDLSAEELDKLSALVISTFGGQFTLDEFYSGLPKEDLMPTIQRVVLGEEPEGDKGNDQAEKK